MASRSLLETAAHLQTENDPECWSVDVSGIYYNHFNGKWYQIDDDVYQRGNWYLLKAQHYGYDYWAIGSAVTGGLYAYRWGGNLFDPCDNWWNWCESWWIHSDDSGWFSWPSTTVTCSSVNAAANDGNAVDGTDDLPEAANLLSSPLPPRGGSDQSDTTHSGPGDYGVMIASAGAAAAFILMVTIVLNVVWRRKKRVSRDSILKTDVAQHVTEMTPSNLDQEVMNDPMSSTADAQDISVVSMGDIEREETTSENEVNATDAVTVSVDGADDLEVASGPMAGGDDAAKK